MKSTGSAWRETTINGTTMSSAFVQWYNATISAADGNTNGVDGGGRTGETPLRWIEQCDVDTCGDDICG